MLTLVTVINTNVCCGYCHSLVEGGLPSKAELRGILSYWKDNLCTSLINPKVDFLFALPPESHPHT